MMMKRECLRRARTHRVTYLYFPLLSVFLRLGMDGAATVAPAGEYVYYDSETARRTLLGMACNADCCLPPVYKITSERVLHVEVGVGVQGVKGRGGQRGWVVVECNLPTA